jgi:cell division septation protein DedD
MKYNRVTISSLIGLFIIGFFLLECSRSKQLASSTILTEQLTNPSVKETIEKNIPPLEPGEIEYFRVQIYAIQNYESARVQRVKVREYTTKDISLVQENDLWKIQVGDFATREEAEKERDILRKLGWIDAWLVRIRFSSGGIAKPDTTIPAKQDTTLIMPVSEPEFYYTVQVIATSNRTEAENVQKNLSLLKIPEVTLLQENNLWKIHIGKYRDQKDAEMMRNQMKEMGFNDSFVVKQKRFSP